MVVHGDGELVVEFFEGVEVEGDAPGVVVEGGGGRGFGHVAFGDDFIKGGGPAVDGPSGDGEFVVGESEGEGVGAVGCVDRGGVGHGVSGLGVHMRKSVGALVSACVHGNFEPELGENILLGVREKDFGACALIRILMWVGGRTVKWLNG